MKALIILFRYRCWGALGGYTAEAMVAGAIGKLVDLHNDQERSSRVSEMASDTSESLVAAHKLNFQLSYAAVEKVEIRGPNFAGELRIIILADRKFKFRIDRQSRGSAKYVEDVFLRFLPGKIIGDSTDSR